VKRPDRESILLLVATILEVFLYIYMGQLFGRVILRLLEAG
jgi:hypothetical protein